MSNLARRFEGGLPAGGHDRGRWCPPKTLGPWARRDCGGQAEDNEELRWAQYLLRLHERAQHSIQDRTVEGIWRAARERCRALRYPSVGRDDDGVYHLTWALSDLPDLTFAVEVDEQGLISWFFRDRAQGVTDGTEEEGAETLPDKAFGYLDRFSQ